MQRFLYGAGVVCLYYAVVATVMFSLRKRIQIPDELFRKMLHFVLQFSYLLFFFAFDTWWQSALFGFIIVLIAYPIFTLLGRTSSFSSFVNERKAGEFKTSLVLAFTMLAICNAICWGWLNDRYFGLACMYAWGIGDGFAALIGKRYGKHKIRFKYADHRKSIEGSLGMFITSTLSVAIVLLVHGHASFWAMLIVPTAGAAVSTFVEMCTPNGMDTVTCPLAAMSVMIPLMFLLGGF